MKTKTRSKPISVAIAGASGYLGGELLRLLLPRPDVRVSAIASQSHVGKPLSEIHPHLAMGGGLSASPTADTSSLTFSAATPAELAAGHDAVFFALPHGVSMDSVAQARAANPRCKLIDLSGDFRLPHPPTYERYYKTPHRHLDLLSQAVYGLPELGAAQRARIKAARLIASPGCFSTTSILALRPFASAGLIAEGAAVVVDAATGSSGSGTHPSATTHHPTRFSNFKAYELFTHRHTPEIAHYGLGELHPGAASLGSVGGSNPSKGPAPSQAPAPPPILFTPHSGPWVRGIYATVYIPLKKEMDSAQAQALLSKHYSGEPFVRVVPQVNMAWTAQTNVAHLSASASPVSGRPMAIVTAALDNLVKGGAGQAVQSFNLAFGLGETTGLQQLAAHP